MCADNRQLSRKQSSTRAHAYTLPWAPHYELLLFIITSLSLSLFLSSLSSLSSLSLSLAQVRRRGIGSKTLRHSRSRLIAVVDTWKERVWRKRQLTRAGQKVMHRRRRGAVSAAYFAWREQRVRALRVQKMFTRARILGAVAALNTWQTHVKLPTISPYSPNQPSPLSTDWLEGVPPSPAPLASCCHGSPLLHQACQGCRELQRDLQAIPLCVCARASKRSRACACVCVCVRACMCQQHLQTHVVCLCPSLSGCGLVPLESLSLIPLSLLI